MLIFLQMEKFLKEIKVGIIGAGGIACSVHIPNYQKIENVHVIAVADIKPEVAENAANRFNISNVFTDWEDLLEIDEIEAVSVCTPNAFHAEPSIAAMKANCHVLCEKPMAVNVAEAQAMTDVAKEHQRILQIGLASRFSPGSLYLKSLIDDGRLGQIYYGRAMAMRRRGIPSWGGFTRKDVSGGGTLFDIGVHAIDHVIWLMGAPKPISVFGSAMTKFGDRHDVINPDWGVWDVDNFDVDDFATGSVRFENGAMLTIETSWASNIENVGGSYILGTDGGVHVVGDTVFEQRNGKLANTLIELPSGPGGHETEVRYFIDAIRNGLPSPVDPEEVLNVQKIMNAVYQSTETGKSVDIS